MADISSQQRLDAAKKKAIDSLNRLEKTIAWLHAGPTAEDRWGRLDAAAKRFEVSFEYVWKAFKAALDHKGEEAYGPKDSISISAKYRWIDDVEQWAEFLQTRNAGVHDYFGLSEEEYAKVAERFHTEAKRAVAKLP